MSWRRPVEALAVAVVAALAYLVCLPWDLRNRPATPGALEETSPVTGVGVLGLVVVLAALAVYVGWRGYSPFWAPLIVGGPPAVLLLVAFASQPTPDASFWPLAWVFFTFLLLVGTLALAGLGTVLRSTRS